jgi:hypothetical protein
VAADRWSSRWVLIAGALPVAATIAATPFSGSAVVLTLLIGALRAGLEPSAGA